MISTNKKVFLLKEVLPLLKNLQSDAQPAFGIMTPQHMVEHLTLITKTTAKSYDKTEGEPTKGHLGFRKFIDGGAIFKHFPKGKTVADLPALKYDSLEEAIAQIPIAVERFYTFFEKNPNAKIFHPFMGEMSFEDLELFHFQHYRYHFLQFGLIEGYP